jgi:hypothetical protein
VIPIRSLQDFAPAIRRKLILEISAVEPQIVPVLDTLVDRRRVDCVLAEATRTSSYP